MGRRSLCGQNMVSQQHFGRSYIIMKGMEGSKRFEVKKKSRSWVERLDCLTARGSPVSYIIMREGSGGNY